MDRIQFLRGTNFPCRTCRPCLVGSPINIRRSLGVRGMHVTPAGPSFCSNAFRSAVITSILRIRAFHPVVDHLTYRARSCFLIAPFLLDPLQSVPPGSLPMYVLLYRDRAIETPHYNIDNDFRYLLFVCLRHAPCSPAWRHWWRRLHPSKILCGSKGEYIF